MGRGEVRDRREGKGQREGKGYWERKGKRRWKGEGSRKGTGREGEGEERRSMGGGKVRWEWKGRGRGRWEGPQTYWGSRLWPFKVMWPHWSRNHSIRHMPFLLVVHWNRASILNRFLRMQPPNLVRTDTQTHKSENSIYVSIHSVNLADIFRHFPT